MELEQLQFVVVDALEDVKAQDIAVFDTAQISDMFERVIMASGTSNRQTRALAMHVRDKVKAAGETVLSLEGEDTGEWLLVDLGPVVVHIMQPAIRAYYNLEELWGGKPVHVKKPVQKRVAKKAAASTDVAAKKPATKTTAKKAAPASPKKTSKSATSAVRKAATKTAAKTTRKKTS
jgi:ribosome-associated protein